MRSLNKPLIYVSLFAVALGLNSCKFFAKKETVVPMIASYPTAVISKGDVTVNTEYAAEVIASKAIDVSSRATGYIAQILVNEGSKVKKGQTIIKIDDKDYRQRVNAAKAAVAAAKSAESNAKLEVEKVTPLVEKNIISKFQLDAAVIALESARAQLAQAEAQLSDAQISLSYTNIQSPVNGVISTISIYQGSLISVGEKVTHVAEDGDAIAYFAFDEKQLLYFVENIQGKDLYEKIASLPPVEFVLADGKVYEHKGKLEVASGTINSTTGSIQLKGEFPNPLGAIRSGASGSVRLPVDIKGTLLVPQKATFEVQDHVMVYVYNPQDSTLQSKSLTIRDNSGDYYAVESGVSEGDIILYEGITKVRDGMKIISQPIAQ